MKSRIAIRLVGLALGIAIMGTAIVVMTMKSQQKTDELRTRLSKLDSESFRIAEQFREFLRQLNSSMYSYGKSRDPAEVKKFAKASHDLDVWIDAQKPKLASESEKNLMQQIDWGYDGYLRAAMTLQTKLQHSELKSVTIDEYTGLMKESQHLFDLGQSLAKAHFESREVMMSEANQNISELRVLGFVSLGCLFLFGLALALVVHRDMVAPLRVKLVESQALLERQEKLASLGVLSAGVAHEIRNPLTAIKAAVFMQQKRFAPGSQEHADAQVVEREILRLEKIVNDFLLFARPAEPKFSFVAVDVLLQEVVNLLTPQLAKNNARLILEKSPPLQIKADAAQIKQVLINLIQNAADSVGVNGMVKLRARRDQKRLENTKRSVVILDVVDNGKGIPPEVQQRLFDPFFTTKETGTGLGLSIAAGIVHNHGGTLQYQTEMNYGTTFGIILPEATE